MKKELKDLNNKYLNDKYMKAIIEEIAHIHSNSFIGRYKGIDGEIKTIMDSNSEGAIQNLINKLEEYKLKAYPELFKKE